MTFSWTTFLFEVINFVVLAFVLHRLLYAPLRAAIAKRQAENNQAREEAEKIRQEASRLQQELEARSADLERQREEVLRGAREQGVAERQKLLREAEQISQRRQEEGRRALQVERDETLHSLRQEVVELAVDLTQRLLHGAADSSLHRQMVLRLIESLEQLTGEQRDRLQRHFHSEEGAVLEAATGIEEATLARLNEVVGSLIGHPTPITLQLTPNLLGGARLRLGGTVWDASLLGHLDRARREPAGDGSPISPEENGQCLTSPCK